MNDNDDSAAAVITVLYVILLVLSFVFMISMAVSGQTPEIDSLKSEYKKAYHYYDSCFKSSKKYMLKKDCTAFFKNNENIKAALRKCQSLDEIIEYKIERWMDKRDDEPIIKRI